MKKILLSSSFIFFLAVAGFIGFEGALLSAQTTDAVDVTLSVTAELTITAPSDVTFSAIAGLTGGTSTGSAAWTIVTNNNAGYTVHLHADASPTLAGDAQGDSIADYTEAVAGTPDFTFVVDDGNAEFGYALNATATTIPDGEIDASFLNNASACATGATFTDSKCWISTNTSGTKELLATTTDETPVAGEVIQADFQVEIDPPAGAFDADGFVVEDGYTSTITLTGTML
ncbi:MAG: hypothetical protein HN802_00010 [Candidatus Jacksonbacteria bacterium]|nr:hypothetical protein [Candidatus Jacksonbacteria bacterium]MBT6034711.1 hypothetical protein [Candidatus Jacksonbacteria bacterium]MBT6757214.1 hypothetical protein [Candidatus Jacksonbacteria bacterium]MBT6954863.1 hypothetical protein [Candidatus Jacksonbacteria bacterium]MBT7008703.1 hypothetical protein [Candidatus Jacksonbacteria bacterium]